MSELPAFELRSHAKIVSMRLVRVSRQSINDEAA